MPSASRIAVASSRRLVADPALAEVPEGREVAPDLRIAHADRGGDAAARDLAAVRGPGGQASQVEAQPLGGGPRKPLVSNRVPLAQSRLRGKSDGRVPDRRSRAAGRPVCGPNRSPIHSTVLTDSLPLLHCAGPGHWNHDLLTGRLGHLHPDLARAGLARLIPSPSPAPPRRAPAPGERLTVTPGKSLSAPATSTGFPSAARSCTSVESSVCPGREAHRDGFGGHADAAGRPLETRARALRSSGYAGSSVSKHDRLVAVPGRRIRRELHGDGLPLSRRARHRPRPRGAGSTSPPSAPSAACPACRSPVRPAIAVPVVEKPSCGGLTVTSRDSVAVICRSSSPVCAAAPGGSTL